MLARKEKEMRPVPSRYDPFARLRHMSADFERMLAEPWPMRFPFLAMGSEKQGAFWPEIDVFERDGRLYTRIDLPGIKKEDITIEATDGHLAISGERKSEVEEKKGDFYRSERQFGSFSRVVPLPAGVKLEEVQATFADGVLEVSMPLPVAPEPKARKVAIGEPATASKPAA